MSTVTATLVEPSPEAAMSPELEEILAERSEAALATSLVGTLVHALLQLPIALWEAVWTWKRQWGLDRKRHRPNRFDSTPPEDHGVASPNAICDDCDRAAHSVLRSY